MKHSAGLLSTLAQGPGRRKKGDTLSIITLDALLLALIGLRWHAARPVYTGSKLGKKD